MTFNVENVQRLYDHFDRLTLEQWRDMKWNYDDCAVAAAKRYGGVSNSYDLSVWLGIDSGDADDLVYMRHRTPAGIANGVFMALFASGEIPPDQKRGYVMRMLANLRVSGKVHWGVLAVV